MTDHEDTQEEFDEMLESAAKIAAIVAEYYHALVENGVEATQAVVLASAYQMTILGMVAGGGK